MVFGLILVALSFLGLTCCLFVFCLVSLWLGICVWNLVCFEFDVCNVICGFVMGCDFGF